ncbi:MAG TPA: UDP-4-amino-4,6-dideoxy-N-acetyl-beta-L-altrosamine transaminase [bacterium]|nr:UDP-4-amino-4,6-dideoxy-N-acetyl-beta-L-altrosamine transaminase [bacterium]
MATSQLALHGGTPVRKNLLPYGHQSIDRTDIEHVTSVLTGDWLTQGPTIDEFEAAFAATIGRRYAVAFANGTAALHGACYAAGLRPGDEAIVPAMTFAATANAAAYLRAKPVFADVDPTTGLLIPATLFGLTSSRTRAILPVHYAGFPVAMTPVMEVAEKIGAVVIEDACHALIATDRGRIAGTYGHLACYSFHPVKPITTGEGGMVVTDDKTYAERLRMFRTHGIVKEPSFADDVGGWYYEMRDLGYNYRMTDIQAALGLAQLKKLKAFLTARRRLAAIYDQAFADLPGVAFIAESEGVRSAYHLYPLLFAMDELTCDKKTLFAALRAEGIGVQVHYIPVNAQPYYRAAGYDPAQTPGAQAFYAREISLPLFAAMGESDARDVVEAVHKVLAAFRR